MFRRLCFDIWIMYLFAIWIMYLFVVSVMYLLYFKLCILKIRICANTRLSPVTYCFLIRSDNNGSRRAKFFPPTIPHSAKWKSQKGRWMLMGVFMDLWFLYLFLQKSQKGHWMLLFVFMFLCLWYFCFQKKVKGNFELVYLYLCRTYLEILKHLLLWIFFFQLFSCNWIWKLNSLSVTDE